MWLARCCRYAAVTNVFGESCPRWPPRYRQRGGTHARDPDVILHRRYRRRRALAKLLQWDRFDNLRAVRNHHVYTVDPSLIGRMEPRIPAGAGIREVCGLLEIRRANGPSGVRRVRGTPLSNKRQWSDDIAQR